MIQSNYTVRIIEPSEGFTLTQSADVDLENRTLSKKVFLAVNDDPSNWKEITDAEADEGSVTESAIVAEADEIRSQQEELAKQKENERTKKQ